MNFDVEMESEDYSVDMTYGLETLQGASEVTRQVVETILNENVPQRLTPKNKVRTRMKKSFQGSYGITFSVEIDDDVMKRRLASIGHETMRELISYFIHEGLYQESKDLSPKADGILKSLGALEDKLIKQLRKSSLDHLHAISKYCNKSVKLQYRKSAVNKKIIASVNSSSANALAHRVNKTKINIVASITRLNINTGNGRLLIDGEDETVAFGFACKYKDVIPGYKNKFSENLDYNNKTHRDNWRKLTLEAHTLKLKDGKVIKYLIEKVI